MDLKSAFIRHGINTVGENIPKEQAKVKFVDYFSTASDMSAFAEVGIDAL